MTGKLPLFGRLFSTRTCSVALSALFLGLAFFTSSAAEPIRGFFRSDCSDTGQPFPLFSPNLGHFKELLTRGPTAPLGEFMVLWDTAVEKPELRSYFEDCFNLENYGRPTRNLDGLIVDSCKPDVLYSWGPKEKIENMERAVGGQDWSEVPNPGFARLWTTISPVSGFPYGKWPVRIKVRKYARFRLGTRPGPMTIRVSDSTFLNDYIIAASEVIESWSYGTPEHYDEIVKDLRRLFSGGKFLGYHMKESYSRNPLEEITVPEGGPPTEETLKQGLIEMIRMILSGEGRIYYGPDVCRSRTLHFATDRPTYFNER